MAQPTPFVRSADYTDDAANALGGRTTVDASKLDAEFDGVVTTLSETLTNLALNQRDDGEVRDGRVKIHTLAADVLSLLTAAGVTVQGAWVTATAYALNDIVTEDGATYICAEAHTSGTFATDLAAVKWVLIANAPDAFAASAISVTPAGNISATDAQAALEELDSEKLSAAGNLAAVADAPTALTNLGALAKAGGTMTGLLTLSGAPTSSLHAATKAYADANIAGLSHGQCRFDYVSATQCRLSRFDGNKLFINGAWYEIPSAGVTLSNSGLSASTWYYVYAYMDGSTMTLEASATGRATDSTYGHQIKNGDSSRTLVGAIFTTAGSQFSKSAAAMQVISWFNRQTQPVISELDTDRTENDTTATEVHSSVRSYFIAWNDDRPLCSGNLRGYTDTADTFFEVYVYLDGSTLIGPPMAVTLPIASSARSGGVNGSFTPSAAFAEGSRHYVTLFGDVTAGSVWTMQSNGTSTQVRVMG